MFKQWCLVHIGTERCGTEIYGGREKTHSAKHQVNYWNCSSKRRCMIDGLLGLTYLDWISAVDWLANLDCLIIVVFCVKYMISSLQIVVVYLFSIWLTDC